MLRRLLNELEVKVEIQGHSPLLVKDGRWGPDAKKREFGRNEEVPAMVFQSRSPFETLVSALKECPSLAKLANLKYFIPGSSVRGAWRSHLEKVLRSLDEEPKVCDPLIANEEEKEHLPYRACSAILVNEEGEKPEVAYPVSCPVCRLFGNTATASRISFTDAEKKAGELRLVDGIAISRFTGSVSGGNYKALVLEGAKFELTIRLRNFELWQVGLLGHLFDDLAEKLVPLGSGKGKGFGEVSAKATAIAVTYYGIGEPGANGELRGLGELMGEGERKRYGMWAPETPPKVAWAPLPSQAAWRRAYVVKDAAAFWGLVKGCFHKNGWEAMPYLKNRVPAAPVEAGDEREDLEQNL